MKKTARFPMRVKFILTLLLLVTVVVGLITFATANMFQDDKKAYVNGLTSIVALATAEEARSLLGGYQERLRLYARLMLKQATSNAEREELSRLVFEEFPELVAVSIDTGNDEPIRIYNSSLIESAGLTREEIARNEGRPLPPEAYERDGAFVRNSTFAVSLPMLTMAFRVPGDYEDEQPVQVRCVVQLDRLLNLTTRFSAYTQFLTDSERNYLSHSDMTRVVGREPVDLEYGGLADQGLQAGITREFDRDGTQMIGGVAAVEFAGVVAGAEIPRSAAHLASRRLMGRLVTLAALLLVGAMVLGIFWAHGITRPVEKLFGATRTIARGDFDVQIEVDTRDEMGDLASSFSRMAGELKAREQKLLEAHRQLVQSEKMAAFGQLGAGIAHEIKNPLTGILACAQLAAEDLAPESAVSEDLALIEKEAKRCKEIIENLLKFARQEKAEMRPTDINATIQDAVAISNHQMQLNEVHVEVDLESNLPPIQGNANQLQQVFLNCLINAQQAMEGTPGRIRVSSHRTDDGRVELTFADTGPGIPEEIRDKLFEPFFTTKPTGKGTGLGLSVSYGIIQDHDGEIEVESAAGEGSTFRVLLPLSDVSTGEEPGVSGTTPLA